MDYETNGPAPQAEPEENTQARIPGADGARRSVGCAGGINYAVLPRGPAWQASVVLETMLRTHFLQQWFSLSDLAMQEAFFDVPLYREFAQLEANERMPDESTILRFRHRLEKYKLADAILVMVDDLLGEQGLLLRQSRAVSWTRL